LAAEASRRGCPPHARLNVSASNLLSGIDAEPIAASVRVPKAATFRFKRATSPQDLQRDWRSDDHAAAYLKRAGFELRPDLSWRPPPGRRHLIEEERQAIDYLVRVRKSDGLLTDAQHAERERQRQIVKRGELIAEARRSLAGSC
jgi:hypothetical protein